MKGRNGSVRNVLYISHAMMDCCNLKDNSIHLTRANPIRRLNNLFRLESLHYWPSTLAEPFEFLLKPIGVIRRLEMRERRLSLDFVVLYTLAVTCFASFSVLPDSISLRILAALFPYSCLALANRKNEANRAIPFPYSNGFPSICLSQLLNWTVPVGENIWRK